MRLALGIACVVWLGCADPKPVVAPVVAADPDAGAPVPLADPTADMDASAPAGEPTKILLVNDLQVDCEGEGPMKCLQVRESETEEWTRYYGAITGFTFEPGHVYRLRVAARTEGGPLDGPSRKVRLVEVVSKRKVK